MDDERVIVVQDILAFFDPPKETAGRAIAALRERGIAVKTYDARITNRL